MKREPKAAIWMFTPYNQELRFWNTMGSMAARDAAECERGKRFIDALCHWQRAAESAGNAVTRDFVAQRISALTNARKAA